jgi:DNA-directed RNA polymerase specialized sigma24 family protein
VGIAKKTAHRRWADYLKAGGREHIPPSKATQEDKAGFAAHLKGNAEEAQQKAAEAQQKAREQALERLRAAINAAVAECLQVCTADEVAAVLLAVDP